MKKTLLKTTSIKAIKQGFVDTPQGQIHYWTAGKGDALLFIHQSSSSAEEYAGLVPYLADKYQLICFDWLGHGCSDDPDFEPGVEDYAESAIAVLNHLNVERCHVLGHHGGALLTVHLGYKYPERVHKLILSGMSGLKEKKEAEVFKNNLPAKTQHSIDKSGQSISDAWKRYINYLPDASPDEILIPFLHNITTRIRPYDAHFGVLGYDRRPALQSLKGPILLLQGTLDHFVTHQEKLLEILPQAERVVVEGAGPFMFYDKSKESAKIIDDFLSK